VMVFLSDHLKVFFLSFICFLSFSTFRRFFSAAVEDFPSFFEEIYEDYEGAWPLLLPPFSTPSVPLFSHTWLFPFFLASLFPSLVKSASV